MKYYGEFRRLYGDSINEGRLMLRGAEDDSHNRVPSTSDAFKPFVRATSTREFLLDAAIMGMCSKLYATSGSSITEVIERLGLDTPSGRPTVLKLGYWKVADKPVRAFDDEMDTLCRQNFKDIDLAGGLQMTHEQRGVLNFLQDDHLLQMYNVIKRLWNESGNRNTGSKVCRKLLAEVGVASKSHTRYGKSEKAGEGKTLKWFTALLRYRLRPWCLKKGLHYAVFDMDEHQNLTCKKPAGLAPKAVPMTRPAPGSWAGSSTDVRPSKAPRLS